VGVLHYLSFISDFGVHQIALDTPMLIPYGLWYSGTVLAILGCHELGHYFACRYYDVDASLPFFIPFLVPIPIFQTGTFGAFIRIREPIPSKRMLFDIGIAGPIAGFLSSPFPRSRSDSRSRTSGSFHQPWTACRSANRCSSRSPLG
jgi:hypothetical protein